MKHREWVRFIAQHPELTEPPWALQYPVPTRWLDTSVDAQVVHTADNHVGLWLKFTPQAAADWENVLQYSECVPDGYDPEIWDDDDEQYWLWLHNQAAHWALAKMRPWLNQLRVVYPHVGWDGVLLADPPDGGPESQVR